MKKQLHKRIEAIVEGLLENEHFLDSVAYVVEAVKEELNEDVKPRVVKEVMKSMNLRYSKIKRIPLRGNKPRSLVLRMLWAQKFLQLPSTMTFIFIDETWVA